ncbi:hypothetical protein TIFTF001_007783 [Ficus carica]|uniref:Uncharacterized protein n=1 Tax=Ficus carica TaxID=3494 RepID=A0AA87ZS83_FICCA|nr:hypothetical protein TIFTF001_007783 [Ficus carica]
MKWNRRKVDSSVVETFPIDRKSKLTPKLMNRGFEKTVKYLGPDEHHSPNHRFHILGLQAFGLAFLSFSSNNVVEEL